jgi:hypothetical protein
MAFIITSKTRRGSSYKSGRRIDVMAEVKENHQKGEDSARRVAEKNLERALESHGIDPGKE